MLDEKEKQVKELTASNEAEVKTLNSKSEAKIASLNAEVKKLKDSEAKLTLQKNDLTKNL